VPAIINTSPAALNIISIDINIKIMFLLTSKPIKPRKKIIPANNI
jgi:hypothetical protein